MSKVYRSRRLIEDTFSLNFTDAFFYGTRGYLYLQFEATIVALRTLFDNVKRTIEY